MNQSLAISAKKHKQLGRLAKDAYNIALRCGSLYNKMKPQLKKLQAEMKQYKEI